MCKPFNNIRSYDAMTRTGAGYDFHYILTGAMSNPLFLVPMARGVSKHACTRKSMAGPLTCPTWHYLCLSCRLAFARLIPRTWIWGWAFVTIGWVYKKHTSHRNIQVESRLHCPIWSWSLKNTLLKRRSKIFLHANSKLRDITCFQWTLQVIQLYNALPIKVSRSLDKVENEFSDLPMFRQQYKYSHCSSSIFSKRQNRLATRPTTQPCH